MARSKIYNKSVWANNIDDLAWSVLDLRVQEAQVARDQPQGAEQWHENRPLDTILDAWKEAYDPQRFDMDYLRLED